MDPVTTAIIAALTAGATSGATEVGKKLITEAYSGLKSLLKKKFGDHDELMDSLDRLEQKPDAAGRKQALAAEVAAAKLNDDPEIISLAEALIKTLEEQPEGEKHIQVAKGSFIAQADRGSTATVNVSGVPDNKDV